MYFVFVLLTTIFLPLGFTVWKGLGQPFNVINAIALKWFVFWGVGIRLGIAGARQFFQPCFTARDILKVEGDDGILTVVKELGHLKSRCRNCRCPLLVSAILCHTDWHLGSLVLCSRGVRPPWGNKPQF